MWAHLRGIRFLGVKEMNSFFLIADRPLMEAIPDSAHGGFDQVLNVYEHAYRYARTIEYSKRRVPRPHGCPVHLLSMRV